MRIRTAAVSAAVIAAPLAAVSFAAGAQAAVKPAATVSATATTMMTSHLDSGFNGDNWATDTISRKVTVTLVGPDANTNDCGPGVSACYTYTGKISDTGTAVGLTGKASPGALDVPIQGSPSARIDGTAYVNFNASSNDPQARMVPATTSGNDESTTDWVEQFFPQGTSFGNGPSLPMWTWTYTDSGDCQSWVDAYNIGKANSGDITGVDQCPIVTHGDSMVTGTHAAITWQSTKTSTFEVTITGPGRLNGKVSHVTKPEVVYSEGLMAHHTYELKIQPLVGGAPAGKAGKITFITR